MTLSLFLTLSLVCFCFCGGLVGIGTTVIQNSHPVRGTRVSLPVIVHGVGVHAVIRGDAVGAGEHAVKGTRSLPSPRPCLFKMAAPGNRAGPSSQTFLMGGVEYMKVNGRYVSLSLTLSDLRT